MSKVSIWRRLGCWLLGHEWPYGRIVYPCYCTRCGMIHCRECRRVVEESVRSALNREEGSSISSVMDDGT